MSEQRKIPVIIRAPRALEAIKSPTQASNSEEVLIAIREAVKLILGKVLKYPESFKVIYERNEKTDVIYIDVLVEDFGRLLGSKGKNISAIRTIVAAMGAAHGLRCVVQVKDEAKFFK